MRQLVLDQVSYQYPNSDLLALQNISFSIAKGDWIALVGHNGSGKSTLSRLLNGLLIPTSGTIQIGDIPLNKETIWDVREKIGMVFQNPDNQFVGTTVQDDVAFGLENLGLVREEMVRRVEYALKQVKMDSYLLHEPHRLSGGQKQRVAIAGVIAQQPEMIILDESTSMLDPVGRQEVLQTMQTLRKEQDITILSITHDLEEVLLADKVIVLNHGHKYAEGTPEEIFSLEKELRDIGLDVPFAYKVSKGLSLRGISLQKEFTSIEELVEGIG